MDRGFWQSRTTFLLAAIGSAVGLGNVWRFPYLAYEFGGGAFLIPYLLALLIIGIPLLMAEFAIGQKLRLGVVNGFAKINRRWGGLGVFMLVSGFLIITYYAVVMAWSLLYFVFSPSTPWAGDTEAFFFNKILNISSSINVVGGIVWPVLIALIITWIMIYFCIWKGVRSVGKVVWLTVPLPIVLLFVLLIRGVTLPGFLQGWAYYLRPDWSALLSSDIWAAAASQIFFTLSLGFGIMTTYASFNKKNQDVRSDALITAFTNSAVSILAGFVVFAILGYMAFSTGSDVSSVVASGPGLAFVVFPEALSLLPLSWLFSLLFFLTLITLGIDSAFSIVEAINTALKDNFKSLSSKKISLLVCIIGFLGGVLYTTNAGLYFLDIIDHFVSNFNLLLAGILEAILLGWIYGADNIRSFISGVSKPISKHWDLVIKLIIPIILFALLINQMLSEVRAPYGDYPVWALSIGWLAVIMPFLLFIIFYFKPLRLSQ